MKWIVILISLPFLGCETPKAKPKHRHHVRHKTMGRSATQQDDVAMQALIKSLKEPNYDR